MGQEWSGAARGSQPVGRVVALLTLTAFVSGIDRNMMPIMIEPIREEFSLSDTQLGFVSGLAFSALYAIVGVPLARLADRSNRSRLIAICAAAWSFAACLCGMAQVFWQFVMARLTLGAAESGAPPASLSILTDIVPRQRLASVISFYYVSTPLSNMVALVMAGWLVEMIGWRWTFVAAGVPGFLVAAAVWLWVPEPARSDEGPSAKNATPLAQAMRDILADRSLRNLMIGGMLLTVSLSAITVWMPAFLARSYDVPIGRVGMVLGPAAGVAALAGTLLGGYIADRAATNEQRRLRMLGFIALITVPVIAASLLAPGFMAAVSFYALFSFVVSLWYGPFFAACQKLAPQHARSTSTSIVYLLNNLIGYGMGPLIVGLISDAMEPTLHKGALGAGMLAVSMVAIGAAIMFWLAAREIRPHTATQVAV